MAAGMQRCFAQSCLRLGTGRTRVACLLHQTCRVAAQPRSLIRPVTGRGAASGVETALVEEQSAQQQSSSSQTPATDASAEPHSAHAAHKEPSFAALGVAKPFADFLRSQGIVKPSAVQAAAIPVLLRRVNAAVQAQTGSGKTLAYLLPVLTNCFADDPEALETGKRSAGDSVLCLVVAPSQELAMQIVRNAQALVGPAARHLVAQCIGGANTRRQLEALKRGKPVMVVGTPGRLAELSLLGHLRTHHVRWLVLDEADELLGPVFVRHLTRLGEHAGKAVRQDDPGSTGSGRATILVSATMAPATLTAYAPWCANPALVRATTAREQREGGDGEEGTDKPQDAHDPPPALPKQLRHMYVRVNDSRMRVDTLRRAIHALDAQRALVFLNFGRRLQDASAKLAARGMAVGSLHGGQSKLERGNTLQAFRSGKLRALLVTDLAARGLDVPECDAVFNLELPSDGTHYAHRAGRTARADQPGICVTLVEASNEFVVRKFERALGVEIQEAKVGGGEMLPMAEVMNRVANSDAADAPTPAPAPQKPAGIKFYKPKGAGRKVKVGSA